MRAHNGEEVRTVVMIPASRPSEVSSILARVQKRVTAMAAETATDPIGEFQRLPSDFRDHELPAFARGEYLLNIQLLREGRCASEEDLASTKTMASQRANEGVPLALVLHNWNRGLQIFWRECTQAAGVGEDAALRYINDALLTLQDSRIRAIVNAYEAERRAIASEESGARHLVARMLLNGQDAHLDAARFGIEIAPAYDVLAVSFEVFPEEMDREFDSGKIASRRKLRKILRAFGENRGVPILPMIDSTGGSVLIPTDVGHSAETSFEKACAHVARVHSETGIRVVAGFAESQDLADLPRAEMLATEIRTLAQNIHGAEGTYRLADVVLAHQLTRPGEASQHLLDLLAPLQPHPELAQTLDCYFRHDLDRGRTARALNVHPNTVNNRLNRITSMLELDLNRVESILLLGCALTIARARLRGRRA